MWSCSSAGCKLPCCVGLSLVPLWGAKGIFLLGVGCQALLPFPDQHQMPARRGCVDSCGCLCQLPLKCWYGLELCVHILCCLFVPFTWQGACQTHRNLINCLQSGFQENNCSWRWSCWDQACWRKFGAMKMFSQLCERCLAQSKRDDFLQKEEFFGALRSVWSPDSYSQNLFLCLPLQGEWCGICSLRQFYLGLFLSYQCD